VPEPNEFLIEEAAELLSTGQLSSAELTECCLARIAATDQSIGSFLEVTGELARAQAAASDKRRGEGDTLGPLDGIPVGLKDLFITKDVATTCASRVLAGFRPRFDGTLAERLGRAGAVLVGKLNMDEFAMGSSTENSALGDTRNPWDLTRVPGGSSGGSATAVAARQALGTFGTDTGGSIRLPASYCGVVGMKPTYGRVSRYGMVAFASSLDQAGPLANSVRGAALLLGAVAGHDPRDSTSIDAPVPDYTEGIDGGVAGLKVGVPAEFFVDGLEPDVESATRRALVALEAADAELVEVSLPHTEYAVATYYIIATAEASSNLGRYDGVRYGLRQGGDKGLADMYGATRDAGFGAEVKRRIMLGTYALSAGYYDAYYLKAMKVRTLIRQDFDRAFETCDVLAMPTAATTAFEAGTREDPLAMYLSDVLTISANLAGLPAISLPSGLDAGGLPVGLQMVAPVLAEQLMFRAAAAYETVGGWNAAAPALEG
jgi:aspartyl-tRNA(Asn)/glutamyl-tRNA(Gln) amidotransferase subunit A